MSNFTQSNKPIEDRVLTKDKFEEVLKIDKYYKGRWDYHSEVINEIVKLDDVNTILELGPRRCPLVENEDVIDISDRYVVDYPIEINDFFTHNCQKVPYPVDKKYDLVIACQVLEHLGLRGEQRDIFDELERICKKAIITLPYKWHKPYNRDHHMIDKEVIAWWANGREPVYEKISEQRNHDRILQIYEFE